MDKAAVKAMYDAACALQLEAIHYRNTGIGREFLNAAIERMGAALLGAQPALDRKHIDQGVTR